MAGAHVKSGLDHPFQVEGGSYTNAGAAAASTHAKKQRAKRPWFEWGGKTRSGAFKDGVWHNKTFSGWTEKKKLIGGEKKLKIPFHKQKPDFKVRGSSADTTVATIRTAEGEKLLGEQKLGRSVFGGRRK